MEPSRRSIGLVLWDIALDSACPRPGSYSGNYSGIYSGGAPVIRFGCLFVIMYWPVLEFWSLWFFSGGGGKEEGVTIFCMLM